MRKFISLLFIFFATNVFAADVSIQKVEIAPLTGGISFNSVELNSNGINWHSWVTCPSVEMIGRKELLLRNTSSSVTIYLTGVSGSTARGSLQPNESATIACASSLHVYASADTVTSLQVWEIR